jgi:acyl-CoA reductase-like NAD-dependent aldehyde dehydrogenase
MGTATITAPDRLRSFDPATGEEVGSVPTTPLDRIGEVVARARAAQAKWASLTPAERAATLEPAAAGLAAAASAIGELVTREMGKPIAEGRGEAAFAADSFLADLREIAASLAPIERSDERTASLLRFDPLGVAVAITPWNFPVLMAQDSVLPALVAGNAVIFKPSEETPLVGEAWAAPLLETLAAAGHPDLLQVVQGDERQGKALVRAEVDLVVFTGSRAAGADILDDADLDAAASFAARNCFRNAGQVCVSTERIYVAGAVAEAFIERLVERAKGLVQGPGMQSGVAIGPMVNARQKQSVLRQVEDAVRRGATLLLGGPAAADREGNFLPPTVLAGLDHSMPIMREETFGPVACVMTFDGDDEAVRLANDSPYGLGGSVFGSEARAFGVAERLATGMVGINRGCGGAEGTPWVGARQSGYGYRGGPEGHRQFAQVRVISRAAPVENRSAGG